MLVAGSCDYIGFYGTPKVILLDDVVALTSPIVGNSELIASVLVNAASSTVDATPFPARNFRPSNVF
jgi:hypothetical protein